MLENVLDHLIQPRRSSNERFNPGPFPGHRLPGLLVQLCATVLRILEDLLVFGVEQVAGVFAERDLGHPAFVVDRHGRPVLDRLCDVIDVDILAEDRLGVRADQRDRRAGKADMNRVRQRLAQVMGEPVPGLPGFGVDFRLEPVLAPVRLIREDDHV